MQDKDILSKQIDETIALLGSIIKKHAVEKDIYVTKIIHAMSKVEHDCFRLVFQGGTCLAKAHKIIPRMSEDCDFRMEIKLPDAELSRTKIRNELKSFRKTIKDQLQIAGFNIDDSKVRTRDEGRFMSMRLEYSSIYENEQSALKPYLAIDFFLSDVKTQTIDLPITTLIRNTLGDVIKHPENNITCVSITETAAEKWVGLTRRIATIQHREYYNDSALVRHMYDLYKINSMGKLGDEFPALVDKLLITEVDKFKSHNTEYSKNPHKEIVRALDILKTKEWKENWEQFINDMVFELNPPSYDEAIQNLDELSVRCFSNSNIKYIDNANKNILSDDEIANLHGYVKKYQYYVELRNKFVRCDDRAEANIYKEQALAAESDYQKEALSIVDDKELWNKLSSAQQDKLPPDGFRNLNGLQEMSKRLEDREIIQTDLDIIVGHVNKTATSSLDLSRSRGRGRR